MGLLINLTGNKSFNILILDLTNFIFVVDLFEI